MKITDDCRIIKSDKLNLAVEIRKIRTNKKTGEKYEAWQTVGWYGDDLRAALSGAAKQVIFENIEDTANLKECLSRLADIELLVKNLDLKNFKF